MVKYHTVINIFIPPFFDINKIESVFLTLLSLFFQEGYFLDFSFTVTFIIICKERVGFFLVGKKMVFTFSEKKCNKNFTIVFLMKLKRKKILYLHTQKQKGGLAQLARAFDWQSKGHRFDSDILH